MRHSSPHLIQRAQSHGCGLLGIDLEGVAYGDTLTEVVNELVIYSDRQPQGLAKLADAAHGARPGQQDISSLPMLISEYELYLAKSDKDNDGISPKVTADLVNAAEDAFFQVFNYTFELNRLMRLEFDQDLYEVAPVDGDRRQIVHALVASFSAQPNGIQKVIASARQRNRRIRSCSK